MSGGTAITLSKHCDHTAKALPRQGNRSALAIPSRLHHFFYAFNILNNKDMRYLRNIIFLLLPLFSATLAAAGGTNVSNPMLWADVPDPDVIRVGEDYYMVSTTMHLMPGVPVMHSKDLVHWGDCELRLRQTRRQFPVRHGGRHGLRPRPVGHEHTLSQGHLLSALLA